MCCMIHFTKNYKMLHNNTLTLMKNMQKLSRITDSVKGSIHFELHKVYQKNINVHNQQRSRF